MDIRPDDLTHPAIHALLDEHLASMRAQSPPGSVHALDLTALRHPSISFWSAWEGDAPIGCGALREIDPGQGEIKSMRTPAALRRRGAGKALLQHILAEARRRGYTRVSLETGVQDSFAAAHALYLGAGFVDCGPFGGYQPDPHSRFLTLPLA